MDSSINPNRHDTSKYLQDNENSKILEHVLNTNGISISTAIVQLFLTKRPGNTEWFKHSSGIICLVKDYDKKSFYFRLFNLNAQLLWEEEMSTQFVYHKITNNFFYFSGYNCNVGLNFAFEEEAFKFQRSIIRAMNSLEKLDYLNRNCLNNNNNNIMTINYNLVDKKKDSGKKAEKKVIDKHSIGNPVGFVHLNHIGLSENNGFKIELNDQNEHTKMIIDVLKQLNIKPNKQSFEYADSFIKSNGGYNKYFKEYKKRRAPKAPKFESKSDMPKKNPKVLVTNYEDVNFQNAKSNKLSTTPNTLKPQLKPPPKLIVYQAENQIEHNNESSTSVNKNLINFLSPTTNVLKYDSSSYITPESQAESLELKKYEIRKPNSAISHEEHRNALLKSIENFKGGLKRVTRRESYKFMTKQEKSDPMHQLIMALGQMRPYLNQSSDSETDGDDNFSF